MTLTFFRSTFVFVNENHSTFFYVLLKNVYRRPPISILIIARMSSKLGNIRTETCHGGRLSAIIFFNMRNIWKTGPDSLTIAMEQNVQFLVGIIYHEKFQLDQSQYADLRPLPIDTFSR